MKKSFKNIIISLILIILSVGYTIMVKNYNVSPIGPEATLVGFSSINQKFANFVGYNEILYKITEVLGLVILIVPVIYALIGLKELIKTKSLTKIDKKFYVLASLYVVLVITYAFFEKVIINYRPVIIDNMLEASYPSSHTMLALCVCLSAVIFNNLKYNTKLSKLSNVCLILLGLIVLLGRLFSGVHWLSDIVGGIIISITLLQIYKTALYQIKTA